MITSTKIDISGTEYEVVINKTVPQTNKAPIFIYIKQTSGPNTFGGYVYAINDPKSTKIYSIVLKSGVNDEQLKNLSTLVTTKFKCPCYINMNNVSELDYRLMSAEIFKLLN